MIRRKKYWTLFILLGFSFSINSQITETDHQMFWGSFGLHKKLSKDVSLNYYQINSFNLNTGQINFIQSDIGLNLKLANHWSTGINYTPTFSIDNIAGNQLVYHRLSAKLKFRHKIVRHLYMKNYLVAEYHFTQRAKWQERFYFRFDLEYKNKHKMPWKLKPYISQKLYWYQNGRLLQYYNPNGDKTLLASPNGLHAYRLKTGFKLYPSEKWSFNFYFLKQKEFNTKLFGSKDINNLNPNSGRIRRSFYDFKVWGLSVGYKL